MNTAHLSMRTKLLVGIVMLLSFLLGLYSLRGDSGIIDEIAHIPAGYNYVVDGDYRLNPEHPPLMKVLSAIPLAFFDLEFPYELRDWTTFANGQWESGWKFIYERGNNPDQIFFWARIPILLSFMVLLWFVFKWSREAWGEKTAFLALVLAAFSPNLLAHARYVTTDMGVVLTFFVAMYAFWKFFKAPSWKTLLWLTVAFAVAQLAKFSNILLPIYLVLLSLVAIIAWKGETFSFDGRFPLQKSIRVAWLQRAWVLFASLLGVVVGGFVLVWIAYAPFVWNTPVEMLHLLVDTQISGDTWNGVRDILHTGMDQVITRPITHYVLGLLMVFARVAGGNTTYFLGEVTNQSFWYFYPVSFLIKTPLPLLAGLAGAFVLLWRGVWRILRKGALPEHVVLGQGEERVLDHWWEAVLAAVRRYWLECILLTSMAMFMVVGMIGNLNIGLRHILPLWPFMILFVAKYGMALWEGSKTLYRKAFLLVLIVWYVLGVFIAYPSFLSYYNELVGQENGYLYSTDSNTDWGQDLKRLAVFVEENGIETIKVDYFGGGVPSYYLGSRYQEWHASSGKATGWIAVSATFFQNSEWYSHCCGEMDYTWLDAYEPKAVIGGSILVYYIEE